MLEHTSLDETDDEAFDRNGPSIWYKTPTYTKRLDDPDYNDGLDQLNLRELRIMEALLSLSLDEIRTAINKLREVIEVDRL